MRLMHISDLHLGVSLYDTDITADIEHALFSEILGRIFREVSAEKKVDGLIIAGDVFDKAQPPACAEEIYGRLLTKAVDLGMKVFVCSGNHDDPLRLSSNEQLMSRLGIYINRPFSKEEPLRMESFGEIDIAMLPNVTLSDVSTAYGEELLTMTDALKRVFEKAGLPGNRRCILVAHQAVAEHDRVIGTQATVDSDVFSGFAYTALGHVHTPQNVGENVRYCGSPVCFSATEAKSPDKFVDVIDADESGVTVKSVKIQPLHEFVTIDDTLSRILSDSYPASDDYCYVRVSKTDGEENVGARIREKFPNMVRLYFVSDKTESSVDIIEEENRDFTRDFTDFYKEVTKDDVTAELLANAENIFRLTEEAAARGEEKQLMSMAPELVSAENAGIAAQEGNNDDQDA